MAFSQSVYVGATNGLKIRENTNLSAIQIGKLKCGDKVEIVEWTKEELTLQDDGNKVSGRWCKIKSLESNSISGYVFSGYLTNEKLSNQKRINTGNYSIYLNQSSKTEFESGYSLESTEDFLNKKQAIKAGKISIISPKTIELSLENDSTLILTKQVSDDQFYGYEFIHYDSNKKLYIIWENWLEAGHPIMIEGSNGKISNIMGASFCSNKEQTLLANWGQDIGAGWTPNGIQVLKTNNKELIELFKFNPRDLFNEVWGPIEIKWKNESTLLIKCIINNVDSGYFTQYKKLTFKALEFQ